MRDYILWLLDEEETEEEGEPLALPSLTEEASDQGRGRSAMPRPVLEERITEKGAPFAQVALVAREDEDLPFAQSALAAREDEDLPFAQSALAVRLRKEARVEAKETSAQPWRAKEKAQLPVRATFLGQDGTADTAPSFSLLAATQEKRRLADYAQPRQAVSSPLLAQEDTGVATNGDLTVFAFDRALERDARRYDKGFSLF